MEYVIGIDGGSTKCLLKAKDLDGNILAEKVGYTTNHLIVGSKQAGRRVAELVENLLAEFGGQKADCSCVVAGAAGIDSPKDRLIVEGFYDALRFHCPIFCMNDGTVALYAATKAVGMLAICGTGSIVVGRNAVGKSTRSGGYSINIMGDEGSSRWISLMALNHMSKWVDQSVPTSPLVEKMIEHFNGFDANKLIQCSSSLYRRSINPELAMLVHGAACEGDGAAVNILKKGAAELFYVAETVVRKLGFDREERFLSGVWGSVFIKNAFFLDEYKRLFEKHYPSAEIVFPAGDAADGAASMALDYLADKISFISELM